MSRTWLSVRLPVKRGMLPGPVRMASATWVGVASCSDGAKVPKASSSPAPVMVWQAAQLSDEQVGPVGQVGPLQVDGRDARARPGRAELTKAATSTACWLFSFGRLGLRPGRCSRGRGRHPAGGDPEVDRGRAHPDQVGGGRAPPWASASWQLEQFCSKSASPAGM